MREINEKIEKPKSSMWRETMTKKALDEDRAAQSLSEDMRGYSYLV
jgi:hypothetical protein